MMEITFPGGKKNTIYIKDFYSNNQNIITKKTSKKMYTNNNKEEIYLTYNSNDKAYGNHVDYGIRIIWRRFEDV